VRASGSATVRASGSATVRAWDSATVQASDSAKAHVRGQATATAWSGATVVLTRSEQGVLIDRRSDGPPRIYAKRAGIDGWRYRGRGLIQVTFHINYLNCGDALREDLLSNPEKLETPTLAARSAGWFWGANALHRYADQGDFKGLTRAINGSETGMEEREQYLARALEALDMDGCVG
jgi:putative chitinase